MNTKAFIAISGSVAFAALLGCSTPEAAPVDTVPPAVVVIKQYDLPLERPEPWSIPLGKVCKLGTSCLALDPRPFEPCLVSTKDCLDKAAEPIEVGQPQSPAPPAVIKIAE
jgi:hypothetical protein